MTDEVQTPNRRAPSVFIGITSKNGPSHHAVTDTLERAKIEAPHFGLGEITHKWETKGDVCMGRGFLTQTFLDHPRHPDFFLSLDDDIAGWSARDLAHAISTGEHYVGGVVPARTFQPEVLAEAVLRGVPPGELYGHLSGALVALLPEDLAHLRAGDLRKLDALHKGHLLPVLWTSLGWTLISRHAIETMVAALPEHERACRFAQGCTYPRLFRFTETPEGDTLDDSTWLARHWRSCGGTVWLDTRSSLTLCHFGVHPFLSAPIVDRLRMMYRGARAAEGG